MMNCCFLIQDNRAGWWWVGWKYHHHTNTSQGKSSDDAQGLVSLKVPKVWYLLESEVMMSWWQGLPVDETDQKLNDK